MRTDIVVIQIEMKDVGMERGTLLRHVQVSRSRDSCWKVPKNPREPVARHKKGKTSPF